MDQICTTRQFNLKIAQRLVFACFYATYCDTCNNLLPHLDVLSKKYENMNFIKIDIDDFCDITENYDIIRLPTLIIFQESKNLDKINGIIDKDLIEIFIQKYYFNIH